MFAWGCVVTTVFDKYHFYGRASEAQCTPWALSCYQHRGGKWIVYWIFRQRRWRRTNRQAADDVLFFYVIWSKVIIPEASSSLTFP